MSRISSDEPNHVPFSTRLANGEYRIDPALLPPNLVRDTADDHVKDECGVFGVFGHPEAANLTYLGLYALQHRGQEGAGIVVSKDGHLNAHRGMGLVSDVFKPHKLARLHGDVAIGHVRYSTFGSSELKNVQPLPVDYAKGSMALGHNGNLVNAKILREKLEDDGAIFQSTTDSEVIIQLIARSKEDRFVDCVVDALQQVIGAWSLLTTNGDVIVAGRDPMGIRPLWLGKLGDAYILASESCALDIIDADWEREIEPGEVIVISESGVESIKPFKPVIPRSCIFEFIYVARPDSNIFGRSVDEVRKKLGANLAKADPMKVDLVMAVPDSSNPAALGYAHEAQIPFDMGFIRNHYVGRTFIEPDQQIRDFGVKIKLNPVRSAIEGKSIVLIDDSVVRGTTARKIIKMLRRCGAKEIHFRISCPPIINSCYYGIDTPNKGKLIAYNKTVAEMEEFLDVDSLGFQTVEGLVDATGLSKEQFCLACFNNDYPTLTPKEFDSGKERRRVVDTSTESFYASG
ncbi:MAG: amidophosphoribosyltransferase [Candidatus Hydrogenedentota bacterium]|nr:MAG: amidophosphoribosyltransferase [Candidatus Hydrogenedentota bacterium]